MRDTSHECQSSDAQVQTPKRQTTASDGDSTSPSKKTYVNTWRRLTIDQQVALRDIHFGKKSMTYYNVHSTLLIPIVTAQSLIRRGLITGEPTEQTTYSITGCPYLHTGFKNLALTAEGRSLIAERILKGQW